MLTFPRMFPKAFCFLKVVQEVRLFGRLKSVHFEANIIVNLGEKYIEL